MRRLTVTKDVFVSFSDGDREIYKQGYMKASEEFLEQSDINNHIIVKPEYLEELERKAQAFDEIVNAVDESANSYELVARIKLEVLKYQKLEEQND